MRVPLIFPTEVTIYRLDIPSTWGVDPPGDDDAGYDPILREPILYDDATTSARTSPRQEMAAVSVPCQPENATVEDLQVVTTGNDPLTNEIFVLHRQNLKTLGLLDSDGNCVLKYGDRIASLTKKGRTVRTWRKPLYIAMVLPRSHGFGPDGYDLEIVYTTHRYTSG